ncbi:hypothetical protein [Pseudomonas gregormendelii]
MSTATCRICGFFMCRLRRLKKSEKTSTAISKKASAADRLSRPQKVRDFSKAFGWAVAHNDGGLERMKDQHDPELGKLVVAFSWWSRALSNGVQVKDLTVTWRLTLHLPIHSWVYSVDKTSAAIKKWERFAG